MNDNFLENGAILPSGLLSAAQNLSDSFKKTFQNTSLKVGIVIETHEKDSPSNLTHMFPEYNVMAIETNEDRGATVITYKNCIAAAALGSIADFFEAKLRKMKKKTTKGVTPDFQGQNGAIVLLLCMNGFSDRGIIVGALGHPDRKTTLGVADELHLEGEYNGVNIKVNNDGSTSLTFKGATDNDGKVIDSSQGNTTLKVEKDGSFQVDHKTITQRLDKNGKASLTADDDISNTTKKNFNVTATENVNVTATKDMNVTCDKLVAKASGTASLQCQKLTVKAESEISFAGSQLKVEAEAMVSIKAPMITLDGMVSLGGQGGQPLVLMSAQMLGIGNLGLPVLSNVISGFTVKTVAI